MSEPNEDERKQARKWQSENGYGFWPDDAEMEQRAHTYGLAANRAKLDALSTHIEYALRQWGWFANKGGYHDGRQLQWMRWISDARELIKETP